MLGLGQRHDVLAASLRLSRACPEGSAIGSRRCVRDQPLLKAVWLSSSGVKGARGRSWPSARLQCGQGAGAACGPCRGLSGWFSQTHPQSLQRYRSCLH